MAKCHPFFIRSALRFDKINILCYRTLICKNIKEIIMTETYLPSIVVDSDMAQIIGIHWLVTHGRPVDLEYAHRLGASVNKIIGGPLNVQQVSDLYKQSPESMIVYRDHPLSEQKDDMANDPSGTGKRHAKEMKAHYYRMAKEAEERDLPYPEKNRVILLGINEPNLDAGERNKNNYKQWLAETERLCKVLDSYTVAFLDECTADGFYGGAFNLSVGWPANLKDDDKPYWGFFTNTEAAIKRGNHFLVLHEYWCNTGPKEMYGWWCGRFEHCPWDVPIIIGECGMDQYVKDGSVKKESRGWLAWVSKEEYSSQIIEYANMCWQDRRIVGMVVFTSDCNHHDWGSFDLLPCYEYLLQLIHANKMNNRNPLKPQLDKPLFGAFVLALSGLNVRKEPRLDAEILTALEYGTAINVYDAKEGWYNIGYGWVFSEWTGRTMPEVPQIPQDESNLATTLIDNFSRLFKVDSKVVRAVISAESRTSPFDENGRMIIRFENHIFRNILQNDAVYSKNFQNGQPAHTNHLWRENENSEWIAFHGNQDKEWKVFQSAYNINSNAALQSISMGMGQVMGFNYDLLGYNSPQQMFDEFKKGEVQQIIGFFGYIINKVGMLDAIKNKDWNLIGKLYNGSESAGAIYKQYYDKTE